MRNFRRLTRLALHAAVPAVSLRAAVECCASLVKDVSSKLLAGFLFIDVRVLRALRRRVQRGRMSNFSGRGVVFTGDL